MSAVGIDDQRRRGGDGRSRDTLRTSSCAKLSRILITALTASAVLVVPPAQAQTAGSAAPHRPLDEPLVPPVADELRRYAIPRQSLHDALVAFARQSGLQLAWRAEDFRDLDAGPLEGEMTARDALSSLLAPLNADFVFTSQKVVAIPTPAALASDSATPLTIAPSTPASAQDPAAYEAPGPDEITVTGTRLKPLRENARFASKHALDADDVKRSGYNDFLNAIADLPTVNAPTTPENTQTSVPSSGQSFIEIRGLGSNRTLVLFDGRRSVSNSYTSNRIDLNTVPLDLVKRVEFVKGGASAVYGADAIAGAVNIIFEKDFEGVRLKMRGGLAEQGGGEEFGASALFGTSINDESGNITIYAGFEHEGAVRATDRDFAIISAEFDPEDNELETPDFSSYVPGGRFPRPGPDFFFDETGLQDDFSRSDNGFAFRPFSTLSIPQERYYGSTLFRQSLSPAVELFSNTHLTYLETESSRAPQTISDLSTGFLIPLDNPFVPDVIRDDALLRGADGVAYRRRLSELGLRGREADRLTLRHWTGVRSAPDRDSWNWELVAGYGRHRQEQSRRGLVVVPNFVNALNVEPDPDNPGSFRCLDPDARANGCVPLNIFGVGSIDDTAAEYIRHADHVDALLEQYTVAGSAFGSIAALPAGPLDAAIGIEWRRDRLRVASDPVNAAGATSASPIIPFGASQSSFDLFAEARAPLLRDHPVATFLSLQAATRLTIFGEGPDRIGVSYNLGAAWAPVSSLKFDIGLAQSIREPDLTERFSPPRGDVDGFTDPCNGVTSAPIDTASQNCLLDPGIAASVATGGAFQQQDDEISGPNAGNRDLTFERGRTLSARVAVAPDVTWRPRLIIEYFDTTIDNAVEAFSSNEIARQCYLRADPGRGAFCDLIDRDGQGQVVEILNPQLNLISIKSAGVESEFSASLPVSALGAVGDVELTMRHTRLIKLEERFDSPLDGGVIDNDLGEPGSAKNTAQFLGAINVSQVSARWRSQYFSRTIDSDSRTRLFAELGIADPLFFEIPASWRHDIYAEWRTGDDRFTLFAGVNNLFDDTGPFFPDGTIQGGSDNHISEFDVLGRFFFAGVEKSF